MSLRPEYQKIFDTTIPYFGNAGGFATYGAVIMAIEACQRLADQKAASAKYNKLLLPLIFAIYMSIMIFLAFNFSIIEAIFGFFAAFIAIGLFNESNT